MAALFARRRLWPIAGLGCLAAALLLALLFWRSGQATLRAIALEPAAMGKPAPVTTAIQIRFDQVIASWPASVTLTFSPPVSGQVSIEEDVLRFTPAAALRADTEYSVELAPGIVGGGGTVLAAPVQWTFHTSAPRLIYLAMNAQGYLQLYRAPLRPDSGRPWPLTAAPLGVTDFAVSPDGTQVVYSAGEAVGAASLWRLDLTGGDPELLLECPQAACNAPAWSPDGKLLLVTVRQGNATTLPEATLPRLWQLDLTTSANQPLLPAETTYSRRGRWSSDGAWITFEMPEGVGVWNVADQRLRRTPSATGSGGVWRPRHDEFVLTRGWPEADAQETRLFLVDPAVGDKLDLSAGQGQVADSAPAWSPDGQWLAVRRGHLGEADMAPKGQIWLLRGDGAEQTPLTDDPDFDHNTPAFSPDGRYVAFVRAAVSGDLATSTIWVHDLEGGNAWEVAPGQAPAWAP